MNKTAILLTTLLSASMLIGCSKDSEDIEAVVTPTPSSENGIDSAGNQDDVEEEVEEEVEENEIIVNTAPEVSSQNFEIDENVAIGHSVGYILATDKENHTLDFFLEDRDVPFTINEATGEIIVSSDSLDYNIDELYEFEVSVEDGEFSTRTKTTVYINEVQ